MMHNQPPPIRPPDLKINYIIKSRSCILDSHRDDADAESDWFLFDWIESIDE